MHHSALLWCDQNCKKAEKPTKINSDKQRSEMIILRSYETSRAREMLALQPMKKSSDKNVKKTSDAVRLKGCPHI